MKLIITTFLFLTLAACSSGGGEVSGSGGGNPKGQRIDDWKVNLLGQEGHGGDAIVCFNIPVSQALEQQTFGEKDECTTPPCMSHSQPIGPGGSPTSGTVWRMTEAGRKSIRSAKPLEQYQAERSAGGRAMIGQLNQMTPEDGYKKLLQPFTALPAPFNRIKETHRKLGWLKERGVADEYGLADVNDSGFENNIDAVYCKELQAVVRRDNQLWYDETIFAAFDTAGQVLIQLHEEIYAWAKSVDKINERIGPGAHEMSDKTRRLILQMLDQNADSQVINDNLEDLGFSIMYWDPKGRYMDTQTCVGEQQVLKDHFSRSHGRDFWLDLELLMQRRYLDNTHHLLEMQHNYPDVLSDMIGLTMAGDSSTFVTEILQLQREFEKPESCEGRF